MMKEQLSEIIDIINDAEDMINGGWKTVHPETEIQAARPQPANRQGERAELDAVAEDIRACRTCGLSAERRNAVPGAGAVNPAVMFIGAGPDADEDKTGLPFVGRVGQYLDKWLSAIELTREDSCFVSNIIKCRLPGSRNPAPEELAACMPFLIRQLEIIKPAIIITLGPFASQVICSSSEELGSLRGRIHSYQGIPVVPTHHPDSVLNNQGLRGEVWADLKRVKDMLAELTAKA